MLFPISEPRTFFSSIHPIGSRRLLSLSCFLLVLASIAFFVDLPVYRFCAGGHVPGDLHRLLTWSELFAHGIGVAIVAAIMVGLDPGSRHHVPRVLATAFGGGLLADIVKLLIARVRPYHFTGDTPLDSFAGCIPWLWPIDGFSRLDHRIQSFPSAHVAVATALAIALTNVYPRGRYLFASFAVLAAAQRIESGAHFLSDACVGAAVGCVAAVMIGRLDFASLSAGRWLAAFSGQQSEARTY